MYGLTRGITTLIGVAIAGGLIWLAGWIGPRETVENYWIAMALVAGAGLVIAFSQLVGGWTKWGAPRASASVLVFGFIPALILGGWILIAAQPDPGFARERVLGWSGTIGVNDIISDLTLLAGAVAFGLGLLFGLVFDTSGPRHPEEPLEDERYAEEPTTAERRREVAYEDRDRDYAYDHDTHVRDDREPVAAGRAPREERATPSAPQPEPERHDDHSRRWSFFRR